MKYAFKITITVFSFLIFLLLFTTSTNKEFNDMVVPEDRRNDVISLQLSNDVKVKNINDVKYIFSNILERYDAGLIINDLKTNNYKKHIYNYDFYMNKRINFDDEIPLLKKGNTFKLLDFNNIDNVEIFSGDVKIICDSKCHEITKELRDSLQIGITEKEIYVNELNTNILMILTTTGFMLLLTIMVTFEMYKKYQLFSIKKLHGFSLKRILLKEVIPIFINQLVIMISVFLLLSLILTNGFSNNINFIINGLKVILLLTVLTGMVITVPILLFTKIRFVDYLKGRSQSKYFLHFNQILISIILLITVVLVNIFSSTLISYYSRYKNSAEWSRMEDFYIVPSFYPENMEEILEDPEWRSLTVEAFKNLSDQGAIYADFNEFTVDEENNIYPKEYIRQGIINVNYINFHNITDSNNNIIKIDNKNNNHVILLPDDGSVSEGIIKDNFQEKFPGEHIGRNFDFIYYDASQTFFTHNSQVINNFSNSVSKIPIQVVTYENGEYPDYDRIIGYSGNPFKIKSSSVEEVKYTLENIGFMKFENMRIDVISAYDDVSQINQNELNLIFGIFMIFLILFYLFNQSINQSLNSYLDIHKKEIAVKRMYGFPVIEVFTEYFILTTWYLLINFIIVFLLTKSFRISLQTSIFSIIIFILFLSLKLKKVYNSSMVSIFKGKEL